MTVRRASRARRIAGSDGSGGGPARVGHRFPPPARRVDVLQPQMLEEGEADHGQQRVVMEPAPGAPLEVVEPQFFLELLVRLLSGPARPDGGGERP